MTIVDNTSEDVSTIGGGIIPPCIGPATNALPEVQPSAMPENSHIGVSTHYVPLQKHKKFFETAWLRPVAIYIKQIDTIYSII